MRRALIAGILSAGLLSGCEEAEPLDEPSEPTSAPVDTTPTEPSEPSFDPEDASVSSVQPSPGYAPPAEPEAPVERKPLLDLAFVGDIVLGLYVFDDYRDLAGPDAPADPFAPIKTHLQADLLFGNLESPVMEQVPETSPLRFGRRFGGSAAAVDMLARSGFDVMSLANNHANDLGRAGLEQTPEILRQRGIVPVGRARYEGSPFVVETMVHEGWRIGLVSATTWLNHEPTPGDPDVPLTRTSGLSEQLLPLVREARNEHDLMVVMIHWGREKRDKPGYPQLHTAHDLVDAGADLVIGHHPHVLQGIERRGDGLIAYSLGNFLFPARVHEYRDTAVLHVRWRAEPRCWADAKVIPMRLDRSPSHAPREATLRERRVILDRVERLSLGMRTRWQEQDGELVLQGCAG